MNVIIVDYDPFTMESRVNVYKNDMQEHITVCSNTNTLASEIINIAYAQDIYEIKTHAPFAFTSEIARQIHEKENNMYSAQKINIQGL